MTPALTTPSQLDTTHPPFGLRPKQHYEILDGLRGVAAIMVVIFHTFETYTNGNRFVQIINHGYLAVDFFFLLSGFVVAYAYDDRWPTMSQWDFYKRRLIRLQPMVIMGTLIGAALFYLQRCPVEPLIASTPVWKMLLVMLLGFTLLPLPLSADIRGWDEMHPLDGPCLVALLRVHRQHPLRPRPPQALEQGPRRLRLPCRDLPRPLRRLRPPRRRHRWLGA